MRESFIDREAKAELAVLVWAGLDAGEAERSLDELAALSETAGLTIMGTVSQTLKRISPKTRIGSGKLEELVNLVEETKSEAVVFDDPLTPAQRRNLEAALGGIKVIDRSQVILDIFAERAQTRSGKIQVELAQLEYLLPRLTRHWTHLSRMRAGVGTRGPGETQLEDDRRMIRNKLVRLKKALANIDRTRRLNRAERAEVPYPSIALVGYTNAGKSSLLRRLTGADTYVADQLFATLDTTARRLQLPDGKGAVLIDTVGFISKLPHELVEAFKGTLEQVVEADLILHVVDAADPHLDSRVQTVERILEELGATARPMLTVYNKSDLPGAVAAPPGCVAVSATKGLGCEGLLEVLAGSLGKSEQRVEVRIPHEDGGSRAWLYHNARVVEERAEDGVACLVAWVTPKIHGQMEARFSVAGYSISSPG